MDESLVSKAVSALQKFEESSRSKKKPKLIEDNAVISLIVAFRKIPNRTIRPHRIPLPHSLHPEEDTEICLLTKNDKQSVKELLESKKVKGVSKVIPIAKLKTNFKTYEAKRELCATYDVFLTDKRLYHMLPRLLGKKFFEKKKFPLPVDMSKKDLASEIRKARDSTHLHLGLGSCCSVPVGRVTNPANHIEENVLAATKGVAANIPRGWGNIRSVHIKTVDSIALPLYTSLPGPPTILPQRDDTTSVANVKRVRLASVETTSEEDTVKTPKRSEGEMVDVKRKRLGLKLSAKKVKGSTVLRSKSGEKRRSKTPKRLRRTLA